LFPWKTKRLEVTHTLEREETDGLQGLGLETEKREKDKLNARALVPQASPSFLLLLLVREWGQPENMGPKGCAYVYIWGFDV
jgi:hypothetical protein